MPNRKTPHRQTPNMMSYPPSVDKWEQIYAPMRRVRPFGEAAVPVDISPNWFSAERRIPASLRNVRIAHAPFKGSFVADLEIKIDFFGSRDEEVIREPFVGDIVLKWDASRRDIVDAPFLFYDEHGSGASSDKLIDRRSQIGTRLRDIAPNTLLLVRLMGDEDVRVSTWQELLEPVLPTHRLIYSILVNTERYLGPLLANAIGSDCEVEVAWGESGGPEFRVHIPKAPDYRSAPLLDIAGSTPFIVLKSIAEADDQEGQAIAQFLQGQCDTVSIGNFIHDNMLVGSCKYPAVKYKGKLKRMLKALCNLGLVVQCDQSEAIVISDAGARLLDILPQRLFDPDMRLRWFDPVTDLIRPEHAEASERWLRSYYGIMRKAALRHGVRTDHGVLTEPEFGEPLTSELLDLLIED